MTLHAVGLLSTQCKIMHVKTLIDLLHELNEWLNDKKLSYWLDCILAAGSGASGGRTVFTQTE